MYKRLARAISAALAPDEAPPPDLPLDHSDKDVVIAALEEEVQRLTRIKNEQFEAIERMAGERTRWKVMYFDQNNKHLNAQAVLERALTHARNQLQRCGKYLTERVGETIGEKDAEAFAKTLLAIDAPPIGIALDYGLRQLRLIKGRDGDETDEKEEVERIIAIDDVEPLFLHDSRSALADMLSDLLYNHISIPGLRAPAHLQDKHVVNNMKLFERLADALVALKKQRPRYSLTREQLDVLTDAVKPDRSASS